MYIVPMAWLYVALMMAVAEATNSNGTVLGAIITFVFYGLGPVALMGTPARKRALKARDAQELAAAQAQAQTAPGSSVQPDAGPQPAGDAIAPVRKEP